MARRLRLQYPGAIYHAMNRGDRREAIFSDDQDRECLLETLAETRRKTDRQVLAHGIAQPPVTKGRKQTPRHLPTILLSKFLFGFESGVHLHIDA